LILKDDTILVERYQYDRRPEHRMHSSSMARRSWPCSSGCALSEGSIRLLDDAAERYVAALEGTPYGETPIHHLLTMSSGVRFTETCSGGSPYSSAETQILGLVLRAATATPLADYLSANIWQPMGAEADASWAIDQGGYEAAYFAVSAAVRDCARRRRRTGSSRSGPAGAVRVRAAEVEARGGAHRGARSLGPGRGAGRALARHRDEPRRLTVPRAR
jgi:CubicO group peptidase (beta-lactamase class C family)